MVDDLTTGRDALHRLDSLTAGAREEFDAAARGADSHARRRADLARLKAESYRQLAAMRLDVIKVEATDSLSAAEKEAARLLTAHEAFTARIDGEVAAAEARLKDAEAMRRAGEVEVDAALNAYETLVTETEATVQTDPGYVALKQAFEEARSVSVRAEQKLELAKTDRDEKRKPYEADPLFSYLWERKFRTPEYDKGGMSRALDNWVARRRRLQDWRQDGRRRVQDGRAVLGRTLRAFVSPAARGSTDAASLRLTVSARAGLVPSLKPPASALRARRSASSGPSQLHCARRPQERRRTPYRCGPCECRGSRSRAGWCPSISGWGWLR